MQHRPVLISTNQRQRAGMVAARLRGLGLETAVVPPGPATVQAVRELGSTLVLVDADHVHGCRTIMLVGETQPTPVVVALADDTDSPQVDGCLLAGAVDLLVWTEPDELAAAIAARVDGVPADRRRAIAVRRREALGRLATEQTDRSSARVG